MKYTDNIEGAWLPDPRDDLAQTVMKALQTQRHFRFSLAGFTFEVITVPSWHWDQIPFGFSRDPDGLTWAWPHRTGRTVFVIDASYERLS